MPRRESGPRLYLRRARGNRRGYYEVRGVGEKPISTGCGVDDIEGARAFLTRLLASTHRPPEGAKHPSQLLITEILAVYRQERETSLTRADMLDYSVPKLVDFWGDNSLAAINGRACRAYVKWRTEMGVSDQTARRDLETLRAAVRYYHEEHGPLEAVPVVKLPSKAEPRQRSLSRQEAARLLRSAKSQHLRRFILIGLYTGMRSQAILQLSWLPSTNSGWIDLEKRVLYRRAATSRKTKKSQNQKPSTIPSRLMAHLCRWHRMDAAVGVPHVVHYQGGTVIKLRRSWKSAREAAGLDKSVIPHVLRHTAATWLMQSGVEIWEAAGYLGMTVETLESVYGHHHPDHQKGVENAFSRSPAVTRNPRTKKEDHGNARAQRR
jgi:integrase